jgi:crotonobetainyl-CoA:carnitine CoA-transferase CaiB-like acyl-CoA transferase
MATTKSVPTFGCLDGLKVLSTGAAVAQPHSAELMAEAGATVIHAENAVAPDVTRRIKYAFSQEHRNQLMIALNISTPEGKEIFLKFIKWADIWMESSKGGTYDSWGLSDEYLWQHNPRLVIVHISGFGQSGEPGYIGRASYDAIGQAYGGYMFINGNPEPDPPMRVNVYTCDYISALNGCWTALAALRKVEKTGKGESIDIAQFEAMMRVQTHYPMTYLNDKRLLQRLGNPDPMGPGYNVFRCKDDNYVFIAFFGSGVMKRGLPLLGLDKDPDFPPGIQMALWGTPAAPKLEKAILDYCQTRTSLEVDQELNKVGVPCSRVMNIQMAEEDPHYQAREVFVEWDDQEYGKVKGVGVVPKFKNNPGTIWRGAPLYGADNYDILTEFGYRDDEIAELYEKRVIAKDKRL